MNTPTTEDPGATTLSPVERDEAAAKALERASGQLMWCAQANPGVAAPEGQELARRWSEQALEAAARLRAPVAPAPIEPGEEAVEKLAWRFQGIMSGYLHVEAYDNEIMGTGAASYAMARAALPKPAPAPIEPGDVLRAAAIAVAVQQVCGLTINGKRALCCDPEADDEVRQTTCDCLESARAVLAILSKPASPPSDTVINDNWTFWPPPAVRS